MHILDDIFKNMHLTKNRKFKITNLTEFGFSIFELFQLLKMKITQNISIAPQYTIDAKISGKCVIPMLKLLTRVNLSGKEIVASHDKKLMQMFIQTGVFK